MHDAVMAACPSISQQLLPAFWSGEIPLDAQKTTKGAYDVILFP
jgi:hypothetical protein